MPSFRHEGHRLAYTVYEPAEPAARRRGPSADQRPLILLHGLLLSQRMHIPLARDLAGRGNRVITLDLLGHGRSDRPVDMWRYSMGVYAQEVVALMDHLELDRAVVGGTSLGANVTLEVAAQAPERLRGMVVEMPVLDNALLATAVAFTPLLVALTFGERVMRLVSRATRTIPSERIPFYLDIALDTMRQDPAPSAALLQGLFFGPVAPGRSTRRTFEAPALILGHRRDPIHPFSDAGMLAGELSHSRLVEANSLVELRFRPERLTGEIADFLDGCWAPPARAAGRGPARPRRAAGAAGAGRRKTQAGRGSGRASGGGDAAG